METITKTETVTKSVTTIETATTTTRRTATKIVAYRAYLRINIGTIVNFNKVKRGQQQEYFKWRHAHPDNTLFKIEIRYRRNLARRAGNKAGAPANGGRGDPSFRWRVSATSQRVGGALRQAVRLVQGSRRPKIPGHHRERHRTERAGWLRAAVLGANDGILSTASLVLAVAAAHATHSNVVVAAVGGLVAGSVSMAAGEYVSVHSQADIERPTSSWNVRN